MGATCLALSLLCTATLAAQGGQGTEAPAPWMELPDDPVGRLWASVGADTQPWLAPTDVDLTWENWAQSLLLLTDTEAGEHRPKVSPASERAGRREASAFLMQFALEDGRAEDAFRWLQGLGADDPEALAGLLPTLFPGVPAGTELLPGGHIPALPNEVFLRPQLPPQPRAPEVRGFSRRSTCRGLIIGESTLDLVLKLDGSGVVAEFTHRGGPAVTLIVQLPAPAGRRLKSLYVDWDLQTPPEGSDEATFDWSTTPLKITIQPQPTGPDAPGYDESFSVFARLDMVRGGIPASPSGGLPRAMIEGGLELHVGAPTPKAVPALPWQDLAKAWQMASGVPVRVTTAAGASGAIRGTAIRFDQAQNPRRLARQVTSAIEGRRRQDHLLYR